MIKTFGVIVFNKKKDVLLVWHEKAAEHITGVYGLLVGRPEEGETPIETAVREAKEEGGVRLSQKELIELPTEYTADIPRTDGSVRTFSMRLFVKDKYEGTIHGRNEETIPQWVSENDFNKLNLLPNIKQAVLEAKQLLTA